MVDSDRSRYSRVHGVIGADIIAQRATPFQPISGRLESGTCDHLIEVVPRKGITSGAKKVETEAPRDRPDQVPRRRLMRLVRGRIQNFRYRRLAR